MEILLVPNELLRQKANKLINITSDDIKIANQMMDTMIKAPGVGLAANQVGILKQIITINFEDKENDKRANYILFNPSIIEYSEEKVIMEEGCLSLPEQYADIERPKINLVWSVHQPPYPANSFRLVAHLQKSHHNLHGLPLPWLEYFYLNHLGPLWRELHL